MMFEDLKKILRSDYQAYPLRGSFSRELLFNPGFRITYHLRICQFLKEKKLLSILSALCRWNYRRLCIKYGIEMPSSVVIGEGIALHHINGTIINSGTIIGQNFVSHGAIKIGMKGTNSVPIIGNNVTVGVNACIIGGVKIGDNATIGAGAVVVKDVPENAIVAGNPATLIRYKGETQ